MSHLIAVPDSATLVKRADECRAHYKKLEETKGNYFHPETRLLVPHLPPAACSFTAPQKNGLPECSKSLVYFVDHEDEIVWFAGQDAEKALAAIQKWYDDNKGRDLTNATGIDRARIKLIPKLKITDGVLGIWLSDWNDLNGLIDFEGANLGLLGRPFVEDGSGFPTGQM